MRASPSPAGRLFAHWAMLLAALALAILPAGAMPARSADGGLTLVLCSETGPVTVTLDPETGKPVAARDRCFWSLAHPPAAVPGLVAAATPAPRAGAALGLEPGTQSRLPGPPGAALPRGPPVLA